MGDVDSIDKQLIVIYLTHNAIIPHPIPPKSAKIAH